MPWWRMSAKHNITDFTDALNSDETAHLDLQCLPSLNVQQNTV